MRMFRFYIAVIILFVVGVALCGSALPHPCKASWYGWESGTVTASREPFNPDGLTAAHRSYPFGTWLRVSLGSRSVIVRVNDRGPAKWTGRCIDLSYGAARRLGMVRRGVATVTIEVLGEVVGP